MADRANSDETYVIDLCDRVLKQTAKRQYTFSFLRGDPGKRCPRGRRLPVDAYYERSNLVVEYHELQHSKSVKFFDKPDKLTCSGCFRGEQRRRYDQLRRRVLHENGVHLIEVDYTELECDGRKLVRKEDSDLRVIRKKLADFTTPS